MDILLPPLVVALEHPRQPPCPPSGFLSWPPESITALGTVSTQHLHVRTSLSFREASTPATCHGAHCPSIGSRAAAPGAPRQPGFAEANSGQTEQIYIESLLHASFYSILMTMLQARITLFLIYIYYVIILFYSIISIIFISEETEAQRCLIN